MPVRVVILQEHMIHHLSLLLAQSSWPLDHRPTLSGPADGPMLGDRTSARVLAGVHSSAPGHVLLFWS